MGYIAKLDEKRRVVVPAKLRRQFTGTPKIRKGTFQPCLILSSEEDWRKKLNDIRTNSAQYPIGHEVDFRKNSFDVPLDGKNRIIIPQQLLDMIEIEEKGEIEFISGDQVELRKKNKYKTL